jgi:hypothetical protein
VVSIFIFNTQALIDGSRTQIKKNTVVERRNNYMPPQDISKNNITIAFKLSDFYSTTNFVDPYYGQLLLKQMTAIIKINEETGKSER